MARKPRLTVALSAQADRDMADAWVWNAKTNGESHADRYVAHLYAEMEKLGGSPNRGKRVPDRSGLFQLTIRRGRGHGHVAFYRIERDEVRIVRVLHTARDWPNLLEGS